MSDNAGGLGLPLEPLLVCHQTTLGWEPHALPGTCRAVRGGWGGWLGAALSVHKLNQAQSGFEQLCGSAPSSRVVAGDSILPSERTSV